MLDYIKSNIIYFISVGALYKATWVDKEKVGIRKYIQLKHVWILQLPFQNDEGNTLNIFVDFYVPFQNDEGNTLNIFVDFYVSKYAWTERWVWCGHMNKVVLMTYIIHSVAKNDNICKIQCNTRKIYQFKISNTTTKVENMKSKKLKIINLKKIRKWWDEKNNKLKVFKTNIITDVMSLALIEVVE